MSYLGNVETAPMSEPLNDKAMLFGTVKQGL